MTFITLKISKVILMKISKVILKYSSYYLLKKLVTKREGSSRNDFRTIEKIIFSIKIR